MVFVLLRWFITSVMFHTGLAYATFVALRTTPSGELNLLNSTGRNFKRCHSAKTSTSSSINSYNNNNNNNNNTIEEEDDNDNNMNKMIDLPISALKLWLMLTFLASLSYIGADYIPFFLEFRVIFTWLLLTLPPNSHCKVYDNAFEPFLIYTRKTIVALESNKRFARLILMKLVRALVEFAILIMKYIDQCKAIEEAAVYDIVGGLVFARRALQDVENIGKGKEKENKKYLQSSFPISTTTTTTATAATAAAASSPFKE